MTLPTVVRAAAILIAGLGALDPAITSDRIVRPTIALAHATAPSEADRALADRLADRLASRYDVRRGVTAGAAATVSAGNRLPLYASEISGLAYAVMPAPAGPALAIEALAAPARAQFNARVPITATVRVTAARGRRVQVALSIAGLAVDRTTRDITSDDERVDVPLAFVATAEQPVVARVTAQFEGPLTTAQSVAADVAIDIVSRQVAVLFFEARPSWMSTFVRRSLEADPRFTVVSRTVTSRGITAGQATAPAGLADARLLARFDVVVVGASDGLAGGDVDGLETFLRRRGGAAVLLLDDASQVTSGAVRRLAGVDKWATETAAAPLEIATAGVDPLRFGAAEIAWPTHLPVAAEPLAAAAATKGKDPAASSERPVIFQAPLGAGRVVVSGALDAWRYRATGSSAFDPFWRDVVSRVADASPPAVEVQLSAAALRPGEATEAVVTVRDVDLADPARTPPAADVSIVLEGPAGSTPLRAWPGDRPGQFRAAIRAPSTAGTYRVVVQASTEGTGAARGDATFVVAPALAAPEPDERQLVAAWAASRGGFAVTESEIDRLVTTLDRAIRADRRSARWYPMRNAWWILPFAGLLAFEWWSRRTAAPNTTTT